MSPREPSNPRIDLSATPVNIADCQKRHDKLADSLSSIQAIVSRTESKIDTHIAYHKGQDSLRSGMRSDIRTWVMILSLLAGAVGAGFGIAQAIGG